jgi:hypothetical protein
MAAAMVKKFKEVFNYVQARMAEAQQAQELQANRHRQEAPILRVSDRVWLKYGKTLSNRRLSRKLDWKNALFEVTEVISAQSVRLNIPGQLHQVFHVDSLRLHPRNPLLGQESDDAQPEAVFEEEDGEPEYAVEDIVGEKVQRRGRGQQTLYMVKWVGYVQCTWETREVVEDLEALENWLAFSQASRDAEGNLPKGFWKGNPQEPLR